MANNGGVAAPFGDIRLGRVVDRVDVELGEGTHQDIGPAAIGHPELHPGHPLSGTVHPHMDDGISSKLFTQIFVEEGVLVVRSILAIEEKAHRVARHANHRLDANVDITQMHTAQAHPIAPSWRNIAGEGAPACIDPILVVGTHPTGKGRAIGSW